jgi:hypothetical protein
MASLLAKFRIDYSDLKVIPDITKKPRESTVSFFESLISEFKQTEGSTDGGSSGDQSKNSLMCFETICTYGFLWEGKWDLKPRSVVLNSSCRSDLTIIFFLKGLDIL